MFHPVTSGTVSIVLSPAHSIWAASCISILPIVGMVGKKSPDLRTHVMIDVLLPVGRCVNNIISVQVVLGDGTESRKYRQYLGTFSYISSTSLNKLHGFDQHLGIHTTIIQTNKLCEWYDFSLLLQWLFIEYCQSYIVAVSKPYSTHHWVPAYSWHPYPEHEKTLVLL